MKIALVANTSWYVYNFRRNLMDALRAAGHEIHILAAPDGYSQRLADGGWAIHALPFTGSGTNPIDELKTVWAIRKLARQVGFDAVLSYTPKGNIYASLALIGQRTKIIPNISGLGRAFIHQGLLGRLVLGLYRLSLGRAHRIFFQNEDDLAKLSAAGVVEPARCELLPGSGVDLIRFSQAPLPSGDGAAPRFLMVARLLWEKGVGEFIEAAEKVKASHPYCRFALLGPIDTTPGRGVPIEFIDQKVSAGIIVYLGMTDDVRPHLQASDCVVLPSYREGVPRSLLEAAATGRPLVTTDAPGCKACVDEGLNGFLVAAKDSQALALALLRIAELPAQERQAMGDASRTKVEREFSEVRVISAYERVIQQLARRSPDTSPA